MAGSDSEKKAPAPEAFPVDRLIAESEAFLGCEAHVAAGALHDAEGDLTPEAAQQAVNKWLARPVA